ncbi:MAG: hypothetical protein K9N35_08290, partial [Candidatus Marinimicrobia bacterium]|nr:hypothetical protein [Candidatus Neomarinimicrobiota bacterium]
MRQLPERKSIRLQGWDYGSNASYFITICTRGKYQYFGEIKDGVMYLSDLGIIARTCWQDIPQHFQYTSLDSFIIMPD